MTTQDQVIIVSQLILILMILCYHKYVNVQHEKTMARLDGGVRELRENLSLQKENITLKYELTALLRLCTDALDQIPYGRDRMEEREKLAAYLTTSVLFRDKYCEGIIESEKEDGYKT